MVTTIATGVTYSFEKAEAETISRVDKHRGKPDFKLGDFLLWVDGWEFTQYRNADDANWLRITAQQKSTGSTVVVSGPIVESTDLSSFLSGLERLHEFNEGKAVLQSHEPNLKLVLRSMPHDTIEMIVKITPDYLAQKHRFRSEIDRSSLTESISALREVLLTFGPRTSVEKR